MSETFASGNFNNMQINLTPGRGQMSYTCKQCICIFVNNLKTSYVIDDKLKPNRFKGARRPSPKL